ncbi:transglutaminase family protein [Thermodesulfobacteriota bacterium]
MKGHTLTVILIVCLLSGCVGRYFHDVQPVREVQQTSLSGLPFDEYWTGIVFNGRKIGFSRFAIRARDSGSEEYEIISEASISFHFMTIEKKITMQGRDVVTKDLVLKNFQYEYVIDGNPLQQNGRVENGKLTVEVVTGGEAVFQDYPLASALYPLSVSALYPVVHGLKIGRSYEYVVYNGETRRLSLVRQQVKAYERSELFPGAAYRIETEMQGQKVTTWIDAMGRPVLEMSLGGVIIAGLESESAAKHYLVAGAFNKSDVIIDYSLIKTEQAIEDPRHVSRMEVQLSFPGAPETLPWGPGQNCAMRTSGMHCTIIKQSLEFDPQPGRENRSVERYLQSSITIPSRSLAIMETAQDITVHSGTTLESVELLLAWITENIAKKPVDVFSALDVLRERQAECQGHAYLYTAFARALGIPTRVVNGLVYSAGHQGFLFHTWTESLINGVWIAIDPTFGQLGVDATHIKLHEGEELADLLPLIEVIGKVKLTVLSYQ